MITYKMGNDLDIDQVIELYVSSTLGARRPVADRKRMKQMLAKANLVITAWDGDLMVGISRCLSDYAYVTYMSDLAVREPYQKQGIGKKLIELSKTEASPNAKLILLAAPAAEKHYPHIGFEHMPQAWMLK
jgi:GNAT superfamily N-acetyltransferase